MSLTLTGTGTNIESNETITIIVSSNGTVQVNRAGGGRATGSVNGDRITFSESATVTIINVTCTGTLTGNGTISATTIEGSLNSSTFTCSGGTFDRTQLTLRGAFTAARA